MNEDIYINLIYKQLSDAITDREFQDLTAWKKSSVEHQQTYDAVVTAWKGTGQIKSDIEVDLDDAFSGLEERMDAEDKISSHKNAFEIERTASAKIKSLPDADNQKPSSRTRIIWLAAAAMTLLLGSTFLLRQTGIMDTSTSTMVTITADTQKVIKLEDGSTITLNKGAQLGYPTKFPADNRLVTLTGEAFFDIAKEQERPFTVMFNDGSVQVLGTSFNINTSTGESAVHVKTGKVKWNYAKGKSKELTPSMLATFSNGSLALTTSSNVSFWMQRQLNFDEQSISEVLLELETNFDVQFSGLDSSLKDCRFSSNFNQPNLEEILDALSNVFEIEFVKNNEQQYQLKGGSCH